MRQGILRGLAGFLLAVASNNANPDSTSIRFEKHHVSPGESASFVIESDVRDSSNRVASFWYSTDNLPTFINVTGHSLFTSSGLDNFGLFVPDSLLRGLPVSNEEYPYGNFAQDTQGQIVVDVSQSLGQPALLAHGDVVKYTFDVQPSAPFLDWPHNVYSAEVSVYNGVNGYYTRQLSNFNADTLRIVPSQEAFTRCMSGPGGSRLAECAPDEFLHCDEDQDGDVDLADFQVRQAFD